MQAELGHTREECKGTAYTILVMIRVVKLERFKTINSEVKEQMSIVEL